MSTNRERAELILFDLMNRDEEVSNAMFGDEYVSYVSALADARLLRPDLPKPSVYAHGNQDKPMWDTGNYFRADALDAPKVALSRAGTVWKMTTDEARDLADALYAAADHAEKEGTDEQDN